MTSALPLLVTLLVDVSTSDDTPLASPFLHKARAMRRETG